uniref:F-box domain-containing protein n=1 Tax=Mycena chlorophos TaxID=658473 RepID=A0ABQ0MG47_MYCCL|nr:predicted protein [Mycena chlorophos]
MGWIQSNREILPFLAEMHYLRRFTGHFRGLFGDNGAGIDSTNPRILFSKLTHLDIFDEPADVVDIITALPSLTHLAFSSSNGTNWEPVTNILSNCARLTTLLLMWPPWKTKTRKAWMNETPIQDVRLVGGAYRAGSDAWLEWEEHAAGRAKDFWDRAEEFINAKMDKEIECQFYSEQPEHLF